MKRRSDTEKLYYHDQHSLFSHIHVCDMSGFVFLHLTKFWIVVISNRIVNFRNVRYYLPLSYYIHITLHQFGNVLPLVPKCAGSGARARVCVCVCVFTFSHQVCAYLKWCNFTLCVIHWIKNIGEKWARQKTHWYNLLIPSGRVEN